ncbi:hypothetical protein CWC22_001460 [Pseudoalteromonas rubra]|uniref:Uncharacterized protein n=1 Tax=Pseudoalteromonas rubra TaxID=43658 RepID=A0A5S3UPT1_9GAMM|nr:hypothetical protein [Pseudoalteromonas rubra]QPB81746.1 hypothetical protein CWC22_001460 [Pseudoalteromonas rubra]
MKSVIKLLFSPIVILFLSGCVSTFIPPVENFQPVNNPKVAVLVQVQDQFTHTHYGTTIFNNFVKKYDTNPSIKAEIFATIKSKLEAEVNAEVVPLEEIIDAQEEELNLVAIVDKKWKYTYEGERVREALLSEGVTATIVIREMPRVAQLTCTQFGCVEFISQGHGLFTRSFLGLDSYYSAASYHVSAEIISQPVDLTVLPGLSRFNRMMGQFNELDIEDPADFSNLDGSFFIPVRAELTRYFEQLAFEVSVYLEGKFEKKF